MKDGIIQWPKPNPQQGGIPITTASTNPVSICSDGAGGVIVAWMEVSGNNYYVKAKRLDASGNPHWLWQTNPVTITSGTDRLGNPRVAVVEDWSNRAIDKIMKMRYV